MAVDPRNNIAMALMNQVFGNTLMSNASGRTGAITPQSFDPALGISSMGNDLSRAGVPAPPSMLPAQPQMQATTPVGMTGWNPAAASSGDIRGDTGTVGAMSPPTAVGGGADSTVNLPSSVTAGMDFNAPPPAAPMTLPQQPSLFSSPGVGMTGWNPRSAPGGDLRGNAGTVGAMSNNSNVVGGLYGSPMPNGVR